MASLKHIANTVRKNARRKNKLDARTSKAGSTVKVKFLRKGATIRTLGEDGSHSDKTYTDPNNAFKYASISAAKRASRELQIANGGLGMGSLKIVDRFPKD